VLAPALVLTPRLVPASDAQAVLLASRAAARAFAGRAPARPAYAVGAATAEEARRAGFAEAHAAEGDAAALARLIAARLDPRGGPLLLAVGRRYGEELAVALRAAGFGVIRRVAYEVTPATALPAAARAALAQGVAHALFLSPRSAAVTLRLVKEAGLSGCFARTEALVLSSRIGDMLDPAEWRGVRVSPRPEPTALLHMLGRAPGARGGEA
jgi:uroporphyrinogen-III synthase